MFPFTPSEVFEVLKGSVLVPPSHPHFGNKPIVVVSVFGSSHLTGRSGFKRAFRLAIDSFGLVNLFQSPEDNNLKIIRDLLYSKNLRNVPSLNNNNHNKVSSPTPTTTASVSSAEDIRCYPHQKQQKQLSTVDGDVASTTGGTEDPDDDLKELSCFSLADEDVENYRNRMEKLKDVSLNDSEGAEDGSRRSTGEKKTWGDTDDDDDDYDYEVMGIGDISTAEKKDDTLSLDGFYNASEGVLFLHLEGAYDPKLFANASDELLKSLHKTGFVPAWVDIKSAYCKYLLLMFSLSHVMILSDVGSSFDTSYLHLFRVLDAIRQKLKPMVVNKLEEIGNLPKDWVNQGRLCSPRLLCLYEVEPEEPIKSPQYVLKPPMKNKKNVLQDGIYNILRKCRIITNISANSLCAIPLSDEYVFLYDESTQNAPSQDEQESTVCAEVVFETCFNVKHVSSNPKLAHRTASGSNMRHLCRPDSDVTTYSEMLAKFKQFIRGHTVQAHKSGFDDDSRKVAEFRHFFVLPTFDQWTSAFTALSDVLLGDLGKRNP